MRSAVSGMGLSRLATTRVFACDHEQVHKNVTHRPWTDQHRRCRVAGMEVRKRIGANVRRLREEKGLSQERFGFESGIDRTYVSGIECGRRNPTATIIDKIAAALGVPAYELLMEPGEQQKRD